MKKLALALVTSAFAVTGASANIGTGFDLGVALGYGATTGKRTLQLNGAAVPGSTDIGGNAANIGIFGGYGWVTGCLYFGGEIGYTFENTKVNDTLDGASVQLKRNGYFNAALRGGYLFTPNTMLYVRLGGNWGKWSLRASAGADTISGSKNQLSFAPGLGLETAVHKNVYVRVEYVYDFGPSVRATDGTNAINIGTLRNQSGKIGLAYKF